jgi:hypothetical protein
MILKLNTILTIMICLLCVANNLYWYLRKDIYPELFIKINYDCSFTNYGCAFTNDSAEI